MNLIDRLFKLNDERAALVARRKERSGQHQSTAIIDQKLKRATCNELKEATMTPGYTQEARDAERRHEISASCRVIKSHASFVGVAAVEMAHMPEAYTPACMDELNEAEGVLRRALDRIDRAKDTLLLKSGHAVAAE